MQFGVCTSAAQAAALKAGGWDFVEENVQRFLRGTDAEWTPPPAQGLPTPSANSLVPPTLPVVGPSVDVAAVRTYMGRVLARAAEAGITTLVFGSGAARNVPDGFDRDQAVGQIDSFLADSGDAAASHGVTLVIEPLNRRECNILNSVAEAMRHVRRVAHPNVKCLVDSYHFWLEDEPLSDLEAAMDAIHHVHVADKDGRVPPGESGAADYRPLFKVLKAGGYDRRIAVECGGFDSATNGPRALRVLQDAWAAA